MNSIVLELQNEVLNPNCNILSILRKAHLIAFKLGLTEFDKWIQNELNGYAEVVPDYRKVRGELRAQNPYNGWIPVLIGNHELEDIICNKKLNNSIGELLELTETDSNYFQMNLPTEAAMVITKISNAPRVFPYSLFISVHVIKTIIEKVKNCILEWTIKLEKEGIKGVDMHFDDSETLTAKSIPQQIIYYYGNTNVINGNPQNSQIIAEQNNVFNYEKANEAISEIEESIRNSELDSENKDTALELVQDIEEKIQKKKKPSIIKAAFSALRDFIISVGAGITVGIIQAKMNGLF